MRETKPKRNKRGRRVGRALLVLLLLICLIGAAYLAYMGAMELMERKEGDDFYAQLAAAVEDTEAQQTERTSISAHETEIPTVQATETLAPTMPPAPTAEPAATPEETPTLQANVPMETWIAPATLQPITEQATPAPTTFVNYSEIDFPTIWQTCPDVVGWIRLNDSVIDYPVVLGEDNDFYLHHLPDGTANKAGSIMMDQANSGDFTEAVNILHGHHMRSGSMFGRLADYKQEEYYKAHPTIRLYTPAGDYDVAVFAAYTVNGYTFGYPTSFEDEAAFTQFVRKAVSATPYETGVELQYGDRILLLSTCAYSYTGARFVVMGKIIELESITK